MLKVLGNITLNPSAPPPLKKQTNKQAKSGFPQNRLWVNTLTWTQLPEIPVRPSGGPTVSSTSAYKDVTPTPHTHPYHTIPHHNKFTNGKNVLRNHVPFALNPKVIAQHAVLCIQSPSARLDEQFILILWNTKEDGPMTSVVQMYKDPTVGSIGCRRRLVSCMRRITFDLAWGTSLKCVDASCWEWCPPHYSLRA